MFKCDVSQLFILHSSLFITNVQIHAFVYLLPLVHVWLKSSSKEVQTGDINLMVHHVLSSLLQKNMPNTPPQGSSAS